MTVEMTFGAWLKRRRRQLDLTQKELARRVSCAEGTIRKLESDSRRPSKQLAWIIATHLDIPSPQQAAFVTFARSQAYSAEMDAALMAMEAINQQPRPLSDKVVVAPETRTVRHNLPMQPTPFIGRSAELSALKELLGQANTRLITIMGPGGMGKTRLALAYAEQFVETQPALSLPFPHGVFFVNLAPLSEAEQMVSTLADALNFQFQGGDGRSRRQQLLNYLRHKKMLLLFDNFEHLLDGVDLLSNILQAAPETQILVTSRERLHLRAEQVYPIDGLAFPDEVSKDTAKFAAVQFFLQLARRHQPELILHDDVDLAQLAHICQLVSGMPLALELAASWADSLSLAEIADELQRGLDFLETNLRDMPERHRSVRTAIDRSWQMLTKPYQEIFAKLSVFRGGFTRETAQAVVDANLRQLARLVSKSLVQGGGQDGRYQIHELLRQYGLEKLGESGQETAVRDVHCAYFCEALQKWEPELRGPQQQAVLAQITADEDNIRVAWRWLITQKKWSQIDKTMDGLARFYLERLLWSEGEKVCRQVTERMKMSAVSLPLQQATLARVSTWQANFYLLLGQGEIAERLLQRSLNLLKNSTSSDNAGRSVAAHASWLLAILATRKPNFGAAKQWAEQSLALYQAADDVWGTALLMKQLGEILYHLGSRQEAKHLFAKSLASFRKLGDQIQIAHSIGLTITSALGDGQLDEAEQLCLENLAVWESLDSTAGKEGTYKTLAWIALHKGSLTQANTYFQQSLIESNEKINYWIPDSIAGQSLIELHQGHYEQAQILVQQAFELSLLQDYGTQPYTGHIPFVQGCLALVKEDYREAQRLLWEAVNIYQALHEQHFRINALSILSIIMLKLGQQAECNFHLHEALQLVIDLRSFNWASSVASIALLLGERGQNARAVELYNLAKTDPLVNISHWFEDIVENPIVTMTATLPSSIIKTAQIQGQMLDRWQTAKSLLQELDENSLETARNPNTKQLLPHNLPSQPTPFIGRSVDLAALDTLFADPSVRLVTIVAAGGMGKTRLALAYAEQFVETQSAASRPFPHGVFFVNLTPLSEAEQMVSALADALNFQFQGGGRSPRQQLLDYLHHKKTLLLFDNFEHLLDGVDLLSNILQAAPEVQLLVTSRERLHLRTEQAYPLKGLTYPDSESEAITEAVAGQFFLQVACRHQPEFALSDDQNLTHLAHICHLVAGMPLALELAASWVDVLPLSKIAAELQQGLNFLETELRDIPARQRSIRAVIDVSWQKIIGQRTRDFCPVFYLSGWLYEEGCPSNNRSHLSSAFPIKWQILLAI